MPTEVKLWWYLVKDSQTIRAAFSGPTEGTHLTCRLGFVQL